MISVHKFFVEASDQWSQRHQLCYLECHLGCKDEFVRLEETSGGVHEDGVGDAVSQVVDPDPDVVGRSRALDGHVEHDAERLQGELEPRDSRT